MGILHELFARPVMSRDGSKLGDIPLRRTQTTPYGERNPQPPSPPNQMFPGFGPSPTQGRMGRTRRTPRSAGMGAPRPVGYADPLDPTDHQSFLKAIDDNPFDRMNHLAFADWLQDRGHDDEAEFRRVMGDWLGRHEIHQPQLGHPLTHAFHPDKNTPNIVFDRTATFPWQLKGWWYTPTHNVRTPVDLLPDHALLSDFLNERPEIGVHSNTRSGTVLKKDLPGHVGMWNTALAGGTTDPTMAWKTYRDMEEALRRSYMEGLARRRQQQTNSSRYHRPIPPARYVEYTDKEFRDKITENPFDATAHGVYADWLQDQGRDDEAEFRRNMAEWMIQHRVETDPVWFVRRIAHHPRKSGGPNLLVDPHHQYQWQLMGFHNDTDSDSAQVPKGVGVPTYVLRGDLTGTGNDVELFPSTPRGHFGPGTSRIIPKSVLPSHVGVFSTASPGEGRMDWSSYWDMDNAFWDSFQDNRRRQQTRNPLEDDPTLAARYRRSSDSRARQSRG